MGKLKIKLGIIGGGNMGAVIINRVVSDYQVAICEQDQRRAAFLRRHYKIATLDLKSLVAQSDIVLVAVKPQDMDIVLNEMKAGVTDDKLVISIAAGITSSYIEQRLGKGTRVIRTMPNMPAQIGEGITAICQGRYATQKDVAMAGKIFDHIGQTVVVKENLIDAITAVSGSGPAYIFLIVEYFVKAAQALGLSDKLSLKLVEQTLSGSVHLLLKQKEEAAHLRARVTSKGGTTQAAMNVFAKHKLDAIFIEALKAAENRAKELSKK